MNGECIVGGVRLRSPIIISSGVWPMEEEFWRSPYVDGVGAICTKGITLRPRKGNSGIRIWETRAGLLNSIGLENPGIEGFVNEYLPRLRSREVPLVLNVWAGEMAELRETLKVLVPYGGEIDALELNVSCPNVGRSDYISKRRLDELREIVGVSRDLWDKPLWVKLSPMSPNIVDEAVIAGEEGADAVVVANTWLGMAIDMERMSPVFDRVTAGLSGPAIFPLTLRLVWEVSNAVKVAVIGCGGVSSSEDLIAMILAGAQAVEIGTITFVDLGAPSKMIKELQDYLKRKGFSHYGEIVGKAKGRCF